MNRIEELVDRLCPDGVPYRKLGEVFTRLKGTPITAAKMKQIASPDGEIRVFAGGKTVIDAHEQDIPNANITRVPAVLVQSRGIIDAVYYDKPFTFKNEMWAYTADDKDSVKYLFYVLKSNIHVFRAAASAMGSLPQISLAVTETFPIPVPPPEVQREVVRILDEFSAATATLVGLLGEELTARRKQYAYYRDCLLTFDARGGARLPPAIARMVERLCPDGVPYRQLGEVCEMKRGVRVVKAQLAETGKYPVYQNCLTPLGYYDKSNCSAETAFVIAAGAAGQVGYSHVDFWAADDCYYFDDGDGKVQSRYLYHFLLNCAGTLSSRVRRASVPRISRESIESLPIPVPPLEVQREVVRILDKFSTLTTSLTSGLPAEIAARRKQYEYYRDKLLSFPRRER